MPPSSLNIHGRIKPTDVNFTALGGCRVDVLFDLETPVEASKRELRSSVRASLLATPRASQSHVSTRTDEAGHFHLSIPDEPKRAGKTLRFVVSSPAGQTIADKSHDITASTDSLEILVDMKEEPPTEPEEIPQVSARRISGRVFDPTGRPVPPRTQVSLFAREIDATTDGASITPVLVTRTDSSGYFFGEAPNKPFDRVSVLVAGIPGEIAITLSDGLIPEKLLVPVEVPDASVSAPKEDGCGKGDVTPRTPSHEDIENAPDTYSTDLGVGSCIRFNKPNRAIEEFDFYTVVRTTEPAIVGFKPGDPLGDSPAGDAPLTTVEAAAAAAAAAQSAKVAATAAATDAQQKEAAAVRAEAAARTMSGALGSSSLKTLVKQMLQGRRDSAWTAREAARQIALALVASGIDTATANAKAVELATAIGSEPLGIVFSTDNALVDQTVETILGAAAAVLVSAATAARTAADDANAKAVTTAKAAADSVEAAAAAEAAKNAEIAERAVALDAAARAQLEAQRLSGKPPLRGVLNRDNPIDWDGTPTFYQAAEIAHGHLLHFKQVWSADGYSLGDLLYSLPLAPGQKKLISVVDWERRERSERTEDTFSTEGLSAALSRDRDLGEVVTGALTESSRGGSQSTSVGVGVGTGAAGNGSYQAFNFGALIGVSGGYGQSDSNAWQVSARNLSSSSLQTLRDRTLQSASAVRGLRSSVVSAVAQGEAVRATTEVVANHNHCHAMTVQYFEVLRHLKLEHKLTDVQECLFVPLPMSRFDLAKALRWRQSLQTYLQRRELAGGFEAARRVQTNWLQTGEPLGRFADESIRSIAGELLLTVMIPMPPLPERPPPKPPDPADTAKEIADIVNPTEGAWGVVLAIATGGASLVAGKVTEASINLTKAASKGVRGVVEDFYSQATPQERYEKFHAEIMPGLVEALVDQLEMWAVIGSAAPVRLNGIDFTLASVYQPGIPLMVSVRGSLTGQYRRGDISQLIIKSTAGMPTGCKAIVNSATIRYRTERFEHSIVDDGRVNDDIDPPRVTGSISAAGDFSLVPITPGTGASLFTPLDAWEQRNPRTEDKRLSKELVEHLNDNLEFYHHAIWWTMDPNRRYMLLDGFYAPGSNNRSVASVVENRVIGIVGNALVLPVARGVHLDPRYVKDTNGNRVNLVDVYKLRSPVPAAHVSLPTRGVFAEAILGNCNSCEEIDDSKFWRWEESPIDEPPAIGPISTDTRRSEPASTQPTPFPTPIVSIQNAPTAPDPAGVAVALNALGKQSFPDITGLAGTQANAAAAFSQALDTAYKFGKEASTLAQQAAMINSKDKALGAIDKAEAAGQIDKEQATQLRMSALKKMVGDAPSDPKAASVADRLKVINDQEASGNITAEVAAQRRAEVMRELNPEEATKVQESAAAREVMGKIPGGSVESVETGTTKVTARPSGSNQGGGGGGLLDEALQLILSATPGLLRNPIIPFDPANPTQEGQTAFAKMVADDPLGTATSARLETYIDTFGFDRAENPTIRGQGIREPWQGVTLSDLDAAIAVANALSVPASQVLAVWISEGKLPHNAVLHGGTMDDAREKSEFAGASLAQVRAFARSLLLFNTFGADPMTAFAPRGGLGGDNLLLGPKNGHNAAFDSSIDSIRAAGVPGFQNRSNADIRDFFTTVGGGLVASHIVGAKNTDPDVVRVRITDSSLASWLWLQAALFEVSRVKLEREFAALYPGTAVDLRGRPWVTYLFWNTNKTPAVAQQFYGGAASAEGAIANRFGSSNTAPSKLNASQLDRYYARGANAAAGQSTAAWANAVMVKFLVETIQSWFP